MSPSHRPLLRSATLLALVTLAWSCTPIRGPTSREPTPAPLPTRPEAETEHSPPVRSDPFPPPVSVLGRLPGEVRALWVVRTTLSDPDSIRRMVERADRAGFNTLIVQVRGRGDSYYQSRWEPRTEAVAAHGAFFDPLALVIQEAHARGLGVHAWVNAHLVGGSWGLPSYSTHIISRRPDLLAVPRALARELFGMDPRDPRYAEALVEYARENQDRVEGVFSSPSSPEVKEHLYSVWMDLLESYDLDGLHFDYIRYPNPDFDYSRGALERFRIWVSPRLSPGRLAELEAGYRQDPFAFPDSLPGPWNEFRRAQITELVERIYHGVKKRKPGVVISAAVFPDPEDAYLTRFQDWRSWIRAGILDVVAPMAYTSDDEVFGEQIRAAVEVAGPQRVWAGIGAYQNTYQGTLDKIRMARDLGVGGISLFSYDWAVSEGEADGDRSFLDRLGSEVFRRR